MRVVAFRKRLDVDIKMGGYLFRGKHVTLRCKNKLTIGRNVTLYDDVFIDALSKNGVTLVNNVSIGQRTIIKASGSIAAIGKGFVIGDGSSFGNDCFVGAAGGVYIGSHVAMGQNVRFHSENHNFGDITKPIYEQGVTNIGITIGNDCWIGAGAVFLDGSSMGNGCVVGANTLVTKQFPDNSVIAGSPARIIRMRE